jgi:hypothetical protein
LRTRKAAKGHAATIDKAEHDFAATGTCPYRPNIVSDKDFKPSEITRKDEVPDDNLEGAEDWHSDVDSPFHVGDSDLLPPASPRAPDNRATARKQ